MKNSIRTIFALALLCAALSTATFASSMYVVQGIAGRNYKTESDPAFPVDVLLNDEVCYVHGLAFGTVEGPLTFSAGTYSIKISIADSLAPCSNAPLIDTTVTIPAEKDILAVTTLDSSGNPKLETFTNDFTPVAVNRGRVVFANPANSPAVQVILQNTTTQKLYTYAVKGGGRLDVNLPAGKYTVEINEGTNTLVSSTNLDLYSQSVTMLFAIGQASNNTVVLETRTVRDVI